MAHQPQRPAGQPRPAPGAPRSAPLPQAAAPAPQAAPAPVEDELALQPVGDEEEEAVRARRRRPQAMPPPITGGKPLDVGDTSRLLVYGGIFVVIVVLATLYMLFKPDGRATTAMNEATSRPSSEKVSSSAPAPAKINESPKSAPTTTAPVNTAAKPASETTKTAVTAPAPANLTNNPVNKATYYAYAKFMAWAYSDGLELPGKALADRFKNEVSLKGVDDPDVTALYNQSMEMFRDCGNNTLRNSGETIQIDGPAGRASLNVSESQAKVRQANINMRVLNRKLVERYGKPDNLEVNTPPPVNADAGQNPMGGSSTPPGMGAAVTGPSLPPGVGAEKNGKPAVAVKPKEDDFESDKPRKDSKLPFEAKNQPKPKKAAGELDE